MEPGVKLDRRIQFRRATLTDDGFSRVEVFTDHGAPVWASKQDVSDGERFRASEVSAMITTRFKVRWSAFSADITPADALICEGQTYNITGIKEVGRRTVLEITAAALQ
ncbi:MAG: phage head closure protein [Cypionkella sp.]|nr:phage head closure protein [Cypionkella sp.]